MRIFDDYDDDYYDNYYNQHYDYYDDHEQLDWADIGEIVVVIGWVLFFAVIIIAVIFGGLSQIF